MNSVIQEKIEQIHTLWDELADFEAAATDAALEHLMSALCGLVDAQNVGWLGAVRLDNPLAEDPVQGWRVRHVRFLHDCFALPSDEAIREQIRNLEQGSNVDISSIRNVMLAGTFRVNRLCDIVSPTWFDSPYYHRYYLGSGRSDAIWAILPVNRDAESYLGIYRGGLCPARVKVVSPPGHAQPRPADRLLPAFPPRT
ncbi:MAG: hypothetical protein KGZ83_13600 [Sulfuricella sp.]|nr:hypothetical protein [Sulfuricella sp.]